jgi:acyl-CoA thioester hydrolase
MIPAPFTGYRGEIRPEWLSDGIPHLNLAYYVLLFDHASNAVFDAMGIDRAYMHATGRSYFVAETHVVYEQEMRLGQTAVVVTTLLDADEKRVNLAHEMFREGETRRVCLQEIMFVSVNLQTSRAAPWEAGAMDRINAALAVHKTLPRPAKLGRSIAIKRT